MRPTVLIVDDHDGFRRLARRLLSADGYGVVGEAADGDTAVREAARLAPDVVLLDLNLPDASGFEVAERLAEVDPAPVVVVTSTHEDDELDALAREHGASAFLPKRQLSGAALAAAMTPG